MVAVRGRPVLTVLYVPFFLALTVLYLPYLLALTVLHVSYWFEGNKAGVRTLLQHARWCLPESW